MQINLARLKQEFEPFEVEIPILLKEELTELISSSRHYSTIKSEFDYESIGKIEQFFLDVLNKKEPILISESRFNRIILAYIGEAVIHHAGGAWKFCDDLSHPGLGTPIVVGYKYDSDGRGMIPAGVRDRLINERKSGIIKDAVEACADKDAQQKRLMEELKNLRRKRPS